MGLPTTQRNTQDGSEKRDANYEDYASCAVKVGTTAFGCRITTDRDWSGFMNELIARVRTS